MRALILVAGAALALSACNNAGDAEENAAVNEALATENLGTDNMMMDANAMNATGANVVTDANGSVNAVATDLATNSADTNLANGM
ncbi:hypothetical protein [Sphingomonas mesophila]|uniref:hypothetical protein n=1 Tax=Sphingomonas mesophila TaxID=2303576 RepID=UPI000E59416E|nr:hypothetical protein [Sphingomonas mesophila]